MRHRSIRFRFTASLLTNLVRAGVSFLTGLVVARGMGPSNFGDFTFLLGSFTSIRALIDMGSSSAFFTFISQRPRGRKFIYVYLAWQAIQFLFMLLFIGLLLPQQWLEMIWLGHERSVVVLALGASFLQQQAWQTFSQVGDSLRKTHYTQFIGFAVVVVHLALVLLLWEQGLLGVALLFILVCIEYLIAIFIAWKILWPMLDTGITSPSPAILIREYWEYCSPLIIVSFFGFAYTFADNWMLQRFGGSRQQGFYAVAIQFSAISMFATISMLQIFWKEVAEAHANGDSLLVERLYKKVSRLLYAVSATVGGFLIPWSGELIQLTLGPAYAEGAPILAIMLLYPLHQTMGQVNSTMFFATTRTGAQVKIGIASAMASIPISYFALAPADAVVPGLGLGAIGLAVKLILLTAVTVNLISWWFCKIYKWNYDWAYQFQSFVGAVFAGGLSYLLGKGLGQQFDAPLFVELSAALISYSVFIALLGWNFPEIIGLGRQDMLRLLERLKRLS